MSPRITAQITEEEAEAIDAAVASGRFSSRAAVVRAGLASLLSETEVVEGEIVLAEAAPVPQRPDWTPAVDVARRAALPVLGTGAAALATRLLLRRRARAAHPAAPVRPG